MSIAPIGIRNNVYFRANNDSAQQKKTLADRINENNEKVLKYPPIVIGLINAACWASVGYASDRVFSKLLKTQTGTKTSMGINAIIGGVMGTYAFFQARKLQKSVKENA